MGIFKSYYIDNFKNINAIPSKIFIRTKKLTLYIW